MNSSNCRTWSLKMAGIKQNGQKRINLVVVPQLRNEGFAKENKESSNDNKDINNNYNITETLNSHSDNSICLLV